MQSRSLWSPDRRLSPKRTLRSPEIQTSDRPHRGTRQPRPNRSIPRGCPTADRSERRLLVVRQRQFSKPLRARPAAGETGRLTERVSLIRPCARDWRLRMGQAAIPFAGGSPMHDEDSEDTTPTGPECTCLGCTFTAIMPRSLGLSNAYFLQRTSFPDENTPTFR